MTRRPRIAVYVESLDTTRTVRHGSYSTYQNWDCRCRPCKDAWAAYHRERRAARREAKP